MLPSLIRPLGIITVALAFLVGSWAVAAKVSAESKKKQEQGAMKMDPKMDKQAMIDNAMGAAPAHIAKNAKIVHINKDGSSMTLREGTNEFTCMADNPDSPGQDPMCADKPGWQWVMSWVQKQERPANTEPGFIYMLKGGSDMSATDPWATATEAFVESPAHVMIVWPFDAKKTGLPTKPQKTGMWIMWANTPYAHLMVNGNPFDTKQVTSIE